MQTLIRSWSLAVLPLLAGLLPGLVGAAGAVEEERTPTQGAEQAALAVLDQFMASFNARDPARHAATYHFPHYRLARGEMSVWETAGAAQERHQAVFPALVAGGWDRSEWLEREIVTASPTKVHVATRFRRLRADGSEIGRYDSLYVVVKVDDHWGVKLRSSFL